MDLDFFRISDFGIRILHRWFHQLRGIMLPQQMRDVGAGEHLDDNGQKDRVNQARSKDARVHQIQLQIEHRPQHEEGELGGGPQGDEAGGHEGVGLTAQTQKHGEEHHQADGENGVIARQVGDHLLRDHLPGEGREQRTENEEDRDVNEIVQGRLGDVAEPLPDGRFGSGASTSSAVGRVVGMANGISSLLPYFRYCHSTMWAVPTETRKPSPTRKPIIHQLPIW